MQSRDDRDDVVRDRVTAPAFDEVLGLLDVPRGGIVYVQSSTDWVTKAGFGAAEVLGGLRAWVTPKGTLVMPSYPCRTTHAEYLSTSPRFDVRKTPAGIGLIPEVFRRSPTARRSLDPDFSITAEGPDASDLTTCPLEADPFGRSSPYQRMIGASATLVGLGVSLNTHSFIHVIDSRYQDSYQVSPYLGLAATTVIDYDGAARVVARRCLAPPFQQMTKPSAVAAAVGDDRAMLATTSIGGALFFRWNLAAWAEWCDRHAAQSTAEGRWPCWLTKVGECVATR